MVIRRSSWLLLLFTALTAGGVALETMAQDRPPATPATDAGEKAQALAGTVQGFNLSPRGTAEGLLVLSGEGVVQVNFPPDAGGYVGQVVAAGDSIHMTAYARDGKDGHGVYELATLTGAKGQTLTFAGPEEDKAVHVEGKVVTLNHARRGEVNGAVLDTGDFVHFGPEAARTLGIAVGQALTADGRGHPMLLGHQAVDADSVNGVAVRRAPAPPRPGQAPPPPRPGEAPTPPRPGEAPPLPPAPR